MLIILRENFQKNVLTKEVLNDGNVYGDKDSFCAMLKWLRWRICQKNELKIVTKYDTEK